MRAWIGALMVAALGAATLFWGTDGLRALTAEGARRIAVTEDPIPVPDLRLQTQTGAEVRLRDLRGKLVVATFIYTRCRMVCPMLGGRMQRIRRALPDGVPGEEVVFLSLSFDPAHDDPERLAGYAGRFGAEPPQWLVARPRAGLAAVLDALGVVVIPTADGGFRHNAAFYLIDRAGEVVAILDERRPEAVVAAVEARL